MKKLSLLMLIFPCFALAIHFSAFKYKYNCPEIHNSMECARFIEKSVIDNDERIERKSEKELVIHFSDGQSKMFLDRADSNIYDENGAYTAIDMLPNNRFLLIHRQFWEGSAYTLVDLESRVELNIPGYAVLSPKGKYIAVAEQDLEAEYNENVLQIYKVTETSVSLIFDEKPVDWAPEKVEWVSENKLVFKVKKFNSNYEANQKSKLFIEHGAEIIIDENGRVLFNKEVH